MNHYHLRSFEPIDNEHGIGYIEVRMWIHAHTLDDAKTQFENVMQTTGIDHTVLLETLTDEDFQQRMKEADEATQMMDALKNGVTDFIKRSTAYKRN